MISNLNYLADQFVFYNLKKIRYGYLQIIDSKGKEYFFGDNKPCAIQAETLPIYSATCMYIFFVKFGNSDFLWIVDVFQTQQGYSFFKPDY